METVKEQVPITLSNKLISEFCERWHIRKLSLFGSILRDDFRPASDIDVLIEFDPKHTPTYLQLYDLEHELESIMGRRKVDIVVTKYLNHRLRDRILASAEVIYEQG